MATPHKWAREIKAWADGAEIEQKYNFTQIWNVIPSPDWDADLCIFRIKPQPKEPQYLYVWVEKSTDNPVFELEKPNHILEDGEHKYVGKIKLEVDDGNDTRG